MGFKAPITMETANGIETLNNPSSKTPRQQRTVNLVADVVDWRVGAGHRGCAGVSGRSGGRNKLLLPDTTSAL